MSEAYTLMHVPVRLVETVQGIANGSLVAVPREPTPEMLAVIGPGAYFERPIDLAPVYRAMLAAAKASGHD